MLSHNSYLYRTMKVVHFAGTLRENQDGVTRVLYRMRKEAHAATPPRNEYSFITAIMPTEPHADISKVRSIPFPLNTDYRLAVCTPRTVGRMLADESPDLIHIHSPCTLGDAAIRYAKKRGIPVIATYHTHFPTYFKYYKVQFLQGMSWKLLRAFYNRCDAVIVPSRATLEDLKHHGLKNLVHIPHGVDTDHFSPRFRSAEWRTQVGANPDQIVVGFVGRLVWEKNLRQLVEAYEQSRHSGAMHWMVVGDGPAREKLETLLPRAHFTGFLNGKELATAFASLDLFVMPSVTETFGNVTVEAMASGTVPVCAAAGGAVDIVESGRTGVLTPPNDGHAIAQALDQLFENASQRKELAQNALEASTHFQWSETLRRYEDLYDRICTEHKENTIVRVRRKAGRRLLGTSRRSN